jgi:putative flavoprotein involved in K+ transport
MCHVDSHARRLGVEHIHDDAWPESNRQFDSPPLPTGRLDLRSAGITSIIWACGYRPDFHWINLPIFDQLGFPVHRRGVSNADGLYFLGLPWLYKWKSATLLGAGEDAAFIAQRIASTDLR